MIAGAEIVGPPAKRLVYDLLLGGGNTNAHYHARWSCPACGFNVDECPDVVVGENVVRGNEEARKIAQVKANAHSCNYGWCAVPMTEERLMLAAISPYHIGPLTPYEWTPTQLARLKEARERRRGSA